MTSDRSLDPFLRQLEEFSDQVFRGQSTSANDLDSTTRGAVQRLRAIDRIPPLDQTRMQSRKDELMTFATSWPLATEPLMPGTSNTNGKHPLPMPRSAHPEVEPKRSQLLALVSAVVLLALIGGLLFGIAQNHRGGDEPSLPAMVQGSPSPEDNSPVAGANWSQFRGGLERTGYTVDPGPGSDLNLLWTFTPQEWINGIVEDSGTVFGFGDHNGLYAIDLMTGAQRWAVDLAEGQWEMPEYVPGPAVSDGTVYVSTSDGQVVAVDAASGDVRWRQQVGARELWEPSVADGRVYVTVDGERIVALDATTGEQLWSWDSPGGMSTHYATIAEGKLFTSDFSEVVYAIDLATGTTLWESEPIGAVRTSAYRDGTLFVPGRDGQVTALDTSDGSIRWSSADSKDSSVLPPVLTDDLLIVVNDLGSARGIDPATGDQLWSVPVAGVTHPPYASGSTLYLETMPGVLAEIDLATGERTGRTEGVHGVGSTLVITGNMLIASGMAGPIRAYVPYPTTATEVWAGTPAPASTISPSA